MRRSLLLASAILLLGAPGAGAVVGGERIDEGSVPWFATLAGGCGGSLVASDRVVTAAHCVAPYRSPSAIVVGGVQRQAARFALAPGWRRSNAPGNFLDDVAVVELDAPVPGVAPLPVGGPVPERGRIVGRGRSRAPGDGETFDGLLRAASLRTLSDAACGGAFRHHRGNAGERFSAPRMLCAIDPDGRAPLSSGCNGDSGGPLLGGEPDAPVLLGIVSWGGAGCGADHLPSVFADANHFRAFMTGPVRVWAPTTAAPARIAGRARVGSRLRCITGGFSSTPTRLDVTWRRSAAGPERVVGRGRTHRVARADRGRRLFCEVRASNDGGVSAVPFSLADSSVQVAR